MIRDMKTLLLVFLYLSHCLMYSQNQKIQNFDITILSTMLSDRFIGEWGFAALIEIDGMKILFDTGAKENTVLSNAKDIGIDLNGIDHMYISHNHSDHTGGILSIKKKYPNSFSKIHVGKGIFNSRPNDNSDSNLILLNKKEIERTGTKFITYENPREILQGVWTTGFVPRKYNEKNWSNLGKMIDNHGHSIEDIIPEDQSLFFDTEKGIVVVSGCGHAGIINTLDHINQKFPDRPIYQIIGGFHLFQLEDEKIEWTANKLKEFGVSNFVGAHCTGINATYKIRNFMGLTSREVLVGSVGTKINKFKITPGLME
tara:strand:+ start:1123 stop:2064 length:942 start_codon:yes stop_codon:yes gene_type:complete